MQRMQKRRKRMAQPRRKSITRRSPRAIAGSPSPACSITHNSSPTIGRRSRTRRWPIPTTPRSSSSARPCSPTEAGRTGKHVSSDENLKILDNLPEEEEDELTPETVRPEGLVDPLPFLTSGLWEKVHIASLVPKEKKEVAKSEMRRHGHDGRRNDGRRRHDGRRNDGRQE